MTPELVTPKQAIAAAQALLDKSGDDGCYVDPMLLIPNPLQGLWIVSYRDPHIENLDGGAIYVDSNGTAHWMTSAPNAEQYQGAIFPPDDEAVLAAEIDDLLLQFGGSTETG